MAYEDTEVPISRSQEQIRRMIYDHKGTGVMFISQPPMEGFEALVTMQAKAYHIRVLAHCRDKDKRGQKLTARQNEQEQRRVWRVLHWHIKAMFEAADSGVLAIEEIIMPYVVTQDGRTIAEHILPRLQEAVQSNPRFLLPTREKVS
jgi:hypothetical protein